jgi:CRISPR-associated protein Csx10
MPILDLVITARAPLVFSERRPGGQFRQTELFVPGSALRGAMAQHLIDAGEKDSGDFAGCFIGANPPLFRNAYPAFHTKNASFPSRPLPATAYSCKSHGGFEGHGVFDSLIDRLCREELAVKVPYLPRCLHFAHDGEGDRVESHAGFFASAADRKYRPLVGSRMTTRVAINRRRRVADPGLLYSPMVISEVADHRPSMFCGSVVGTELSCAIVQERLPELTHVGSGAARGFGRVQIRIQPAPDSDIAHRVVDFNARIFKRWQLWENLPRESREPAHAPGNGSFFALILVSDAILLDRGWTPTIRLEKEMLRAAGEGATLVRCYASVQYRSGWNTAWGYPKDTQLAARMGSVYVYHVNRRPDDEQWLKALKELEEHGVGERRVEGFGQVRVCDEFHLEIQEVAKK